MSLIRSIAVPKTIADFARALELMILDAFDAHVSREIEDGADRAELVLDLDDDIPTFAITIEDGDVRRERLFEEHLAAQAAAEHPERNVCMRLTEAEAAVIEALRSPTVTAPAALAAIRARMN